MPPNPDLCSVCLCNTRGPDNGHLKLPLTCSYCPNIEAAAGARRMDKSALPFLAYNSIVLHAMVMPRSLTSFWGSMWKAIATELLPKL